MKTTQERNGRWSAEIPGVARSYGATRLEAIAGVTVLGLRVMADRIEHREMVVGIGCKEDELERIETLAEELMAVLIDDIPNAETISSIEAGRRGDVTSFNSVEELMADLNAED
jgi:Asp-tRNA(Asn)/Glu-tRNA(Gln) amidotransferase C subunit